MRRLKFLVIKSSYPNLLVVDYEHFMIVSMNRDSNNLLFLFIYYFFYIYFSQ